MSDPREAATRALEHEIGLMLRRVRKGIADRAVLMHPDLSATSYSLLLTLVDHGPRRATDLADMFALDKGAVSRSVRQLLDLGLVARTPDPSDARASILEVTDRARMRIDELVADRRQVLGDRLADWQPEAIDDLAQGLARFNASISE